MKAIVASGAAVLLLLLGSLANSAEPPANAVNDVSTIDWDSLNSGSPIPEQMPAGPSDDPFQAGFARQWIERAVLPPGTPFALKIASIHRDPDDQWAQSMEQELWDIIRTKIQAGKNPRVFCNSVGCLSYVERAEDDKSSVYLELLRRGPRLGLTQRDLFWSVHYYKPCWELVTVWRPDAGKRPNRAEARKSSPP